MCLFGFLAISVLFSVNYIGKTGKSCCKIKFAMCQNAAEYKKGENC